LRHRYEPEKAKRSERAAAEGEIIGPSPEEIWRTEDIWT
jgi:hypothetical protein